MCALAVVALATGFAFPDALGGGRLRGRLRCWVVQICNRLCRKMNGALQSSPPPSAISIRTRLQLLKVHFRDWPRPSQLDGCSRRSFIQVLPSYRFTRPLLNIDVSSSWTRRRDAFFSDHRALCGGESTRFWSDKSPIHQVSGGVECHTPTRPDADSEAVRDK